MNQDLKNMDPNQIINKLEDLIAQGNAINNIVAVLDDIRIIANYDLLIQKGATNIHLAKISDSVDPEVVLNNISVFQNNNVQLDFDVMLNKMGGSYWQRISEVEIKDWLSWGVPVQALADKLMQANSVNLSIVRELLDRGAHIDGNKVIDSLLINSDYLIEDFNVENDLPLLQSTGASHDSIQKLLKRKVELTAEDEVATYGGEIPNSLDLNAVGQQTTKIFFVPQIQIIEQNGGRDVRVKWAGRILPGQTVYEGIATELKEVYGYTGRFEWRNPYFMDWTSDNKGNRIQRYGIYITLLPSENDKLAV